MLSVLPYLAANALWLAGGWKATRAFGRALRAPRRAQERLLQSLLRENADSDYGRRCGFGRIRSVRAYQDAVPIVAYEDIAEDIAAIKRGRQRVLTVEPVLMLEKTGGSTAASKYIPYTARLKREFGAAIAPWMADLYGHRPALMGGGAYWSVSPLGGEREVTEGGLPVGFEEDTEYFRPLERFLLRRLILTPPCLPRIPDITASRYVTLRFLLQTPDLAFLSVWNPSFLSLLIAVLDTHAEPLIEDIRAGTLRPPVPIPNDLHRALAARLRPRPRRAHFLRCLLDENGTIPPEAAWPRLRVLSCWTEASAARFLPELRRTFPRVEIQPKGLLATEGVVSVPRTGREGAALAVTSHFLEFVDEELPDARPRLADELETGRIYTPLLSTGGGLYRYALGDRVQAVGRVHATPLVRFLGRSDHVSDLCGEKLHEQRVREVLEAAFAELGIAPAFALLAPEWGHPPVYVLFLEARETFAAERLARGVEAGLAEGHHYAYCRRLGQLGPVRVFVLRPGTGSAAYEERCVRLGQRRGNIKPSVLHRETGWTDWFTFGERRGGRSPS